MEKPEEIREEALRFIRSQNTMVVSTVSESGEPHAATVYFVINDDLSIYFMTATGSQKYQNLNSSGKIAFVIGTGPEINSVQGGGMVESLDASEAVVFFKLIEKIVDQSLFKWPITKLATEGYSTFKIKPDWMVWYNLDKEHYPDLASDKFYKII